MARGKKMGRPKLPIEKMSVNLTITLPPELARLAASAAGCSDKDNKDAVRMGIIEMLQDEFIKEKRSSIPIKGRT